MNIEILGSGSVGRYLAYQLASAHNVTLRSLRDSTKKSHVINNSCYSLERKKILITKHCSPDLRLYASTLSNLSKIPIDGIPTLILTNGSILIQKVAKQQTGVIAYLSTNCTSEENSFVSSPVSKRVPTIYSSYRAGINSTSEINFEVDKNNIRQIEKCLRTIFYSRLAGKDSNRFLDNSKNQTYILNILEPLAAYHPEPEQFIINTIRTLNDLPKGFIPTIARTEFRFKEESKLINNLFDEWALTAKHYQ